MSHNFKTPSYAKDCDALNNRSKKTYVYKKKSKFVFNKDESMISLKQLFIVSIILMISGYCFGVATMLWLN